MIKLEIKSLKNSVAAGRVDWFYHFLLRLCSFRRMQFVSVFNRRHCIISNRHSLLIFEPINYLARLVHVSLSEGFKCNLLSSIVWAVGLERSCRGECTSLTCRPPGLEPQHIWSSEHQQEKILSTGPGVRTEHSWCGPQAQNENNMYISIKRLKDVANVT